jgi:glycosyltransferase involved in cell wall biosynthesis
VTAIVPDGIDDPSRPSGGNRYDRRAIEALRALGVTVTERAVTGCWPRPDGAARQNLQGALAEVPAGSPALVDGLIASGATDLVIEADERAPVVVLVHMPFGPVEPALAAAERAMLTRVSGVVTTSEWTRAFLVTTYRVPAERVVVATPGADLAPVARPKPAGTRLLWVAAVTRAKGHDVLLSALAALSSDPDLADSDWCCTCVGSLDVDPGYAQGLRRAIDDRGLSGRVHLTGPAGGQRLDERFASADLLVLPSRSETWGLVVTEALARAVPVLASDVGGVPEALGRAADGRRPGLLVPAADPLALADALRRWLTDAALRDRLRHTAADRRTALPGWQHTAARLSDALVAAGASAPSAGGSRAGRGWSRSF